MTSKAKPERQATHAEPMRTPDGRYLVVAGKVGPRLWRGSNPALPPEERQVLVDALMTARRSVKAAKDDPVALARARAGVDQAKRGLGERGPVWWSDGAPDINRTLVKNSPYREWWRTQIETVPPCGDRTFD